MEALARQVYVPSSSKKRTLRYAETSALTGQPKRRCTKQSDAVGELADSSLPRWSATTLKFTPPLDWDAMLAYLSPRAIPGVEAVSGNSYTRTLSVAGTVGVLRVARSSEDELSVALATDGAVELSRVARSLRQMFDLDAAPDKISRHFADDELIGPLVARRPGLRVPGAWDAFEFSVRVILGQQVSVAGATTLTGRLVKRHGVELFAEPPLPGLTHAFPRAATLANADLAPIGLPRTRARSISSFASAVAGDAGLLCGGPDLAAVIARLVALPGIGPWTANYIAMRALGQPDAFPESDLGLLRAATKPGKGRMKPADLLLMAERWRPLRAYAAMQLWLSGYQSAPAA